MDMSLSQLMETEKDREAWRSSVHGSQRVQHDLATEQQQQQPHPLDLPSFSIPHSSGLPKPLKKKKNFSFIL